MATNQKEKTKRRKLVQEITDIIQMGTPAVRNDSSNFLFPVLQATLQLNTIKATYYTQSRESISERKIDPYHLVPRDQRFYLIGYCHKAQDIRTFRMSRFRDVSILDETFSKGEFNLKAYLKNTWSIDRGDQNITFRVKFSPEIARYIKEEELFVKPKLMDLPDGSLLFGVKLYHDREFLAWLSQYGPDAEILAPIGYRERVKDQLKRWLEVYQ
ncbi:UNVERIFIED_CONTAM: putative DNA-binding transcriptional regulator YafY [Brevibacillus sp. OAP136]